MSASSMLVLKIIIIGCLISFCFGLIMHNAELTGSEVSGKEYRQKMLTACQKDHQSYECELMLKGFLEAKRRRCK